MVETEKTRKEKKYSGIKWGKGQDWLPKGLTSPTLLKNRSFTTPTWKRDHGTLPKYLVCGFSMFFQLSRELTKSKNIVLSPK